MIARNHNIGRLLYISKDDLCLQEVAVWRQDQWEENFWKDVKEISYFYRNNIQPPLLEPIVYNERKRQFELNWEVGRSQYLTYLYGYKDQKDFEEKNHQLLLDINRALKHLRENKVIDEDKSLIKKYKLEEVK